MDSLEMSGTLEICRYTVAKVLNRNYPTLATHAKKIDLLFVDSVKPEVLRLLRQAGFVSNREMDLTALDRLASSIATSSFPSEVLHRRHYIILSEMYNYCIRNGMGSSREWLNPWELWKYYIYKPLDVFEYRFGVLLRQFLIKTNAMKGICIQSETPLISTIRTLSKEWLNTSTILSNEAIIRFDDTILGDANIGVVEKDSRFVDRICVFLSTGNCAWKRTVLGYQVE